MSERKSLDDVRAEFRRNAGIAQRTLGMGEMSVEEMMAAARGETTGGFDARLEADLVAREASQSPASAAKPGETRVRGHHPDTLIEESARDAAADVTEEDLFAQLKSAGDSLEPIREEIRKSRKPRMRTVEQYLCDNCDQIISSPVDGFVVQGNIYLADPSVDAGLIGNNFPDTDEPVLLERVKRTVLCKSCFIEAVGLNSNCQYANTPVAVSVRDPDTPAIRRRIIS